MKRKVVFAALFLGLSGAASTIVAAGDRTCRLLSERCVDSGCKTINGFEQCMDCWEYKKTYECITPGVVDYCSPFVSISGCYQSSSRCIETSQATGECLKYTQTWRCDNPANPPPSNTIRLDDTYTLVSSKYDRTPCNPLDNKKSCQLAESNCVRTTPPTLPPGIKPSVVAPDGCYERKDSYACIGGDFKSNCEEFANDPNCKLVDVRNSDGSANINGVQTATTKRWECMTAPGRERTIEDCSGQSFCMDGNCFDSGSPPDGDMLQVAVTMEAAREAGRYFDPNTFTLFRGEPRHCVEKLLVNCCNKGSKSTQSNRSVMEEMGMEAAKWLGKQAYDVGSKYVYDFMWDSGIFKDFAYDGLADVASSASSAAMAANFSKVGSFYGVTVWTGAASSIPAAGGLGTVNSLFSVGGFNFGFDPYSLAISLAIQVIMKMMSCDEASIYTSTYKETGLCHYIGEYCSKKFLGACTEQKHGFCCFNSKLAKLINEQGREQIGKGWGTAKNPDCSGFRPEEFERLNFERMDLTEFYSEVVPRDMKGASGDITNYMGSRIGEHVNGQ